jgi:hypothetical protein
VKYLFESVIYIFIELFGCIIELWFLYILDRSPLLDVGSVNVFYYSVILPICFLSLSPFYCKNKIILTFCVCVAGGGTGVWIQALFCLSYISSPFCSGYFGDGSFMNYLSKMTLNCNTPDLSLPSSTGVSNLNNFKCAVQYY